MLGLAERLRSNFPRFDVNPGTGEPLGKNTRMVTQDNTVYHNAGYPSRIVLSAAAATLWVHRHPERDWRLPTTNRGRIGRSSWSIQENRVIL
ncbi:MAG: hypothetical protein NTV52_07060 [Acidobacteria bacterium]|nr:hypothetical protein [Acidobacteriota bacterium]